MATTPNNKKAGCGLAIIAVFIIGGIGKACSNDDTPTNTLAGSTGSSYTYTPPTFTFPTASITPAATTTVSPATGRSAPFDVDDHDMPNHLPPAPAPRTTPKPAPKPTPKPASAYYANCDAARAAGAAPLLAGQPGYRSALDADHDGVACEPKRS